MDRNFDYASRMLMEKNEERYVISGPARDTVFHEVLSSFNNKPIKIFQVGAIESFVTAFRIGSGWSDVIFGKYIREHGGTLTVVDIDLDHLANSHLAASNLGYPLRFVLGDAINYINDATLGPEGYDIYYLDGADENQDTKIGGNQQTLEQFKKIENTKSVVIVDDIEIKAVHLIEYLFKRNVPFNTHNVGNDGMITVDMRDSP